jgi:tRNA (guanine-N7-)-methyltransferase
MSRLHPAFSVRDRDGSVHEEVLQRPGSFDLDAALPGTGPWDVEIGYGKGRHLLDQSRVHPERRYLGIEVVSKYYKMLRKRFRHWGAENLLNVRGEALYLLSTVFPRGFADRLHVYFPDPWPKLKHHRRRLFDRESVDLVLGVLKPGGELCFATDFLDYGELVLDLLQAHPDLDVDVLAEEWPDGARTNYEAKYIEEGRPIIRCRARLSESATPGALHPRGVEGVVCAWTVRSE